MKHLKAVTMIDPVTGWFKIVQYYYKKLTSIENLVQTRWLSRYTRLMEITYEQESEFIGHDFGKSLIET